MKKILILILGVALVAEIIFYFNMPREYENLKYEKGVIPYTFKIDKSYINVDKKAINLAKEENPKLKKKIKTKIEIVVPYEENANIESKALKLIKRDEFIPKEYDFMRVNNDEDDLKLIRYVFETPDDECNETINYKFYDRDYDIDIEVIK